jgi:O-antigen/teichoic acid export membrane protein
MVASLAASGGIQALNVVTGILLARELGPHDRGELGAILLWVLLTASMGSIGLPEALTYETARARRDARLAVGTASRIWAAQSLVLTGIGAGVVAVTLHGYSPSTQVSGFLFLTVIPLYLATNLALAVLQGSGRLGFFNVARTLVPFTSALCLVVLAVTDEFTVRAAVFAYVLTYATTALVGVLLLVRANAWGLRGDLARARTMIGYGLRSSVLFVATTLNERLDQLLISLVLGATDLGLYVC